MMVWVSLPLVAVTTTLEVAAAALPLPPQPLSCVTAVTPAISTRASRSARRFFHPRRKQAAIAKVAPSGRNGLERCWRAALLLSVNVRAVEALWSAAGVTVGGLKLQLRFDGKVVGQLNVVAELNPY